MKKSIIIPLTAMLIFTGCNNSSQNDSSSESSQISTENPVITASDTTANLSKTADEIETICIDFLTDYYDGTKEADFDKCFGNFPDFYLDMLEKEVDVCGETHEEYMQGIYNDYVESFGDDFNISFQVADSGDGNGKGILYLYDDSLEEFKNIFKDTYGADVNLEEAYTIYITTAMSGSKTSYTEDSEWFILKIDGKYYLYENYYETNSVE